MSIRSFIIGFSALVCLLGTACTKTDPVRSAAAGSNSQPLIANLEDNYSFSIFYHALKRAGLDKVIDGAAPGTFTLLVPDNDAFGRDSILNDSAIDQLDTAYLRLWMSYHILPGTITSGSVPQSLSNPYPNLAGQTLYFSRPVPQADQSSAQVPQALHINGDTVNNLDQMASNGVIQVMNRPLRLPVPTVQSYLSSDTVYSYLVAALQHFGMWDQLTGPGPFTIWAPNNEAFRAQGITPDSLTRIDTSLYQSQLIGIYVLTPARVFLTDFSDIQGSSSGYSGTYLFFPDNGPYFYLLTGQSLGVLADYISSQQQLPAPWTDPDVLAVNGTVQGIGGLLVLPSQAKK
jgi:uncharacterized surface protein with fasciclin (FAS1) repeats